MSWAMLVLGVAGVGKTALGSMVARLLNARFIDLPEYVREQRLYSEYDEAEEAYVVDLRRVAARIGSEIRRSGKTAVISSVYAFKPRGVEVRHALVLRLRPDVLMRVLKERGYPVKKIAENVSAELVDQPLHDAAKLNPRNLVQLNVTGVNLERLAEEVARRIRSGGIEEMDQEVDWISELERIGRLDEVLMFLSKHA